MDPGTLDLDSGRPPQRLLLLTTGAHNPLAHKNTPHKNTTQERASAHVSALLEPVMGAASSEAGAPPDTHRFF